MKIFLIKWEIDNCYLGQMIVANNEEEVRELAKRDSPYTGDDIWDIDIWDVGIVTLEGDYRGAKTEPFKLLSDFKME